MFPQFVSEIGTIIVQAFVITLVGYIFVDCVTNLLLKRKGGKSKMGFRIYVCAKCGYSAWAMDHIIETKCLNCGATVKTKPIPKIEKSSLFSERAHRGELKLNEK